MSCNELTLLKQLIAIPSPSGGEAATREFLAGILAGAGLQISVQSFLPERANLLARSGTGGKYCLLLSAHMDTEMAENASQWEHAPFDAAELRGRIYGRGANDTKGTLAAFMQALIESAASIHSGEVMLVLTCSGETDNSGAFALREHDWLNGRSVTGVIVGETSYDEKYKSVFRSYPSIRLGGTGRMEVAMTGDFSSL
ncbi:MAG: M20/M25/M40 family metallo-hydrolase, partial [Candidatus Wallbacteria bacterium]|nr:M20/M25/M40 family metallo-hydrolase [Candidatus Wallbacteria bacterium]